MTYKVLLSTGNEFEGTYFKCELEVGKEVVIKNIKVMEIEKVKISNKIITLSSSNYILKIKEA